MRIVTCLSIVALASGCGSGSKKSLGSNADLPNRTSVDQALPSFDDLVRELAPGFVSQTEGDWIDAALAELQDTYNATDRFRYPKAFTPSALAGPDREPLAPRATCNTLRSTTIGSRA